MRIAADALGKKRVNDISPIKKYSVRDRTEGLHYVELRLHRTQADWQPNIIIS